VIAFPKNRRAFCPLTEAPSFADNAQLEELALKTHSNVGPVEWVDGAPISSDDRATPTKNLKSEKISTREVNHVAKLARLELSDQEAAFFQEDLNSILDYVETLKDLDTDHVSPMSHVFEINNVWRDDQPRDEKETEPLLENAPMREKGYYKVPKILEG